MTHQFPLPNEYQAAVQTPRSAFTDPELQAAKTHKNPLGLPLVASGGFTVTYQLVAGRSKWAVRCFKDYLPDRHERYQEISQFLHQYQDEHFVPVDYQADGIRVGSSTFPILKMQWLDGHTLNAYIDRHIQEPAKLAALRDKFIKLVQHLERVGVAHGDLQHGNILVVGDSLKLVDYDGMFVPALAGRASNEIGHVNFQHPTRSSQDFHANLDRFPAIVIYIALQALAVQPALWKTYGQGGENVLFRHQDFVKPDDSALLRDLEALAPLQDMVRRFRSLCTARLDTIPRLEDFIHSRAQGSVQRAKHITTTIKRPHEVCLATDLDQIRGKVGDRVEVVGKVVNTRSWTTKLQTPCRFINFFRNFRQDIFQLVIWSDGLDLFERANVDPKSYDQQWISITGLISTYYSNQYKSTRYGIDVKTPSEIEIISEEEAQNRLQPPKPAAPTPPATSVPVSSPAPTPSSVSSAGQAGVPAPSASSAAPAQQAPTTPSSRSGQGQTANTNAASASKSTPQPVSSRQDERQKIGQALWGSANAASPSPADATQPKPQKKERATKKKASTSNASPSTSSTKDRTSTTGTPGQPPSTPKSAPAAQTPSTMVVCALCNAQNRSGAKVCNGCGQPLVPAFQPLQPGQSLHNRRYTIRRQLSQGGMGAIYLADDHRVNDRTVAIKVMLDYFDRHNPQAMKAAKARFRQEGNTLAGLSHSAIPMILDSFQEGGHNYIVMQYIEGDNLEQKLTREDAKTGTVLTGQPYPLEDVIQWGSKLCRVLEYLANLRPEAVIHQDIKPANLVLARQTGDLYLVDFGTARVKVASPLGHQTTPQKSIYGTPGYAPPEQYQGHTEPRSDVYALAATLYHLATDNDPQSAPYTFPRLAGLGQFGEALKPALQQDVTLRPTAQQLRQHLEQCLQTLRQPVQSLPPTRPRFLAPDQSTELHDKQELAEWCEKHWTEARSWLYKGGLSPQIASIWNDTSLADKVEQIARQQPDPDAGLDALMCLLNPNLSPPHIQIDDPRVDYGELLADKPNRRAVSLRNDSRRYVCLTFSTPDWISLNKTEVRLRAGESASIQLNAHPARLPRTALASATLEIYVQGGSSVFIPITAKPARQKTPEPVAVSQVPRPAPTAVTPTPVQLRTPDGLLLTKRSDVVRWCEDNWLCAVGWIYQLPRDDFANQLENVCRGNIRSDTVRALLSQHSNDRHFALDSLLALLDPHGYGAESHKVSGSPSVAFGKLSAKDTSACSIVIKNSGNRYLSLRLEPPSWVTVDTCEAKLVTGQEMTLTFTAHPILLPKRSQHKISDRILVYHAGKYLCDIQVKATVSRWRILRGYI